MEKNELVKYFEELALGRKEDEKKLLIEELEHTLYVLPVEEFDYVLESLRSKNFLTISECKKLKEGKAVTCKNLIVYGLDSRLFAEVWAIGHLQGIDSRFIPANHEPDLQYMGDFDVTFEQTKIGVKACRAVDTKAEGDRFKMALPYNLSKPFSFRFRYLNIQACAVFVLIGVWSNKIMYWVLSQKDLREKITRIVPTGGKKAEVILEISNSNIAMFNKYRVDVSMLVATVQRKANDTGI